MIDSPGNIVESVAKYIGLSIDEILKYSEKAPLTYKKYQIKKKTIGFRTIYHPSKTTKSIQYALISTFLNKLPVHKVAKAYIRKLKSPLKENAAVHLNYPYTVRVDIKDFFSINIFK